MRQLQVRHPRIELIVTIDRPIRLIHVGQQDIVIEYCPVLSLCYATAIRVSRVVNDGTGASTKTSVRFGPRHPPAMVSRSPKPS